MPSEKVLVQKQNVVAELKAKLDKSVAGVLVDYKGISVADDTKLRKELREAGVDYAVVKNTLLKRAVEEAGYAELSSVLEGTTAFACSESDPVAAARILAKFANNSKGAFSIKAGFVEGKVLDVAGVDDLAKLPSREQLLGQLLSVLTADLSGLARALNAIAEKDTEKEPA